MKITEGQFDAYKNKTSITDFKQLDVNNDGMLDDKDLSATTNQEIKNALQNLLNEEDEDAELDCDFSDLEDDVKNASSLATDVSSLASANIDELEKTVKSAASNDVTKVAGANVTSLTGYVDVDVSNLEGKTKEELNAMLTQINKNITLIEAQITSAEKTNKEIQSQIDELKSQNTQLEKEITPVRKEISDLESDITKLKDSISGEESDKKTKEDEKKQWQDKADAQDKVINEEQEKLDVNHREFDSIQEDLNDANNAILREQGRAEGEYEEQIDIVTKKAINSYDPAKDGTFEAYYLKCMSRTDFVVFDNVEKLSDVATKIGEKATNVMTRLIGQAKVVYDATAVKNNYLAEVKKCETDIAALDEKMKPVKDQISAKESEIENKKSLITGKENQINANKDKIETLEGQKIDIEYWNTALTNEKAKKTKVEKAISDLDFNAADILALISAEEKKLILDNGIDITKGYYIAQAKDGNWHVYNSSGTSVAREFGAKSKGQSRKGTDITPMGSGYVKHKKTVSSGGKTVYHLSEVNADLTDGKQTSEQCTYDTESPLSFDVNGDGVHTSTETVQYDIDGDGKLDTINNSAEWVLAFDKDKNGVAGENGSELFGNNTDLDGDGVKDGYKNGFDALKALAQKEGLVGENDDVLDEKDLKVLGDKYGLVMTNGYGGESKSLSDLGITQINLAKTDDTTLTKNFDGQYNDIMRQDGATFVVNGQTREYADIWNAKLDSEEKATTNNSDFTFSLNKDKVVVLKGHVDYDAILDEAKRKKIHSSIVDNKIKEYEANKKAEEEKEIKEQEEAEMAVKAEQEAKEQEKIKKQKEAQKE